MRFTDTNVADSIRVGSKIPCETASEKGYATPDNIIQASSPQSTRVKITAVAAYKEISFSGTSKSGSITDGSSTFSWDAGAGFYTADQVVALIVSGASAEISSISVTQPVLGNTIIIESLTEGEAGNATEITISSASDSNPLVITGDFDGSGGPTAVFNLSGGYNKLNLVTENDVADIIADNPDRFVAALTNSSGNANTIINLVAGDNGKIIETTASTAVTINMPATDPGVEYSVAVLRLGSGSVTFAENGKTINSYNNLRSIAGQHAWASVFRTSANTYNLSGTLA